VSPPPGVQLQADSLKGPPAPLRPPPAPLRTPEPQSTLTQPAGNLATQRVLRSPDSSPLSAFVPDPQSVGRVESSSLSNKLGASGSSNVILQSRVDRSPEGDTLHFNTIATGQGSRGSVQSTTQITLHFGR